MPAASLERRLLIVTAVALYGAVFIAFVAFEVEDQPAPERALDRVGEVAPAAVPITLG